MPPRTDDVTAVLLIAHGSRHEPANADLRTLADRMAGEGRYPIVEPGFLELTTPGIPEAGDRCVARGATRVLMVPYFLSMGVHLLRDLTAAREGLASRHPGVTFVLGPPLGPDPLLDRLVAERVSRLDAGELSPIDAPSAEAASRFAPMDG
jgi:sirohydrochlorin ferrochelatase